MGFNSPIDNLFVQLAFEGCQWLCKTKITKKTNNVRYDQDVSYKIRWKKF